MADYLGDIKLTSGAVYFSFLTVDASGVPTTLSGSPAIGVRRNGTVLTLTTPPTLTADADSITGSNKVTVTFTQDDDYTAGADYEAYISAGTVDGVSVVGAPVARWSIENRQVNLIKDGAIDADTFATGVLSTDEELAGVIWSENLSTYDTEDTAGYILNTDLAAIGTDVGTLITGVTVSAIGTSVINSTAIASGALTAAKFGSSAITSTVLADGAITAAKVATGAIDADALASDGVAEIANAVVENMGVSVQASGTPTTTSIQVDNLFGLTNTQSDNALILHLDSGAYSRITDINTGTSTITVSPALPAAPDSGDKLVIFAQYLASL